MLDCEGSFNSVEPIRSLSEMEPSGVSVEVTKSCTNKDHCQSGKFSTFENSALSWGACRCLEALGDF